jgi:ABC-type lipoprotein export system ATPase subunit
MLQPPDAPLIRADSVCKSYRNGSAETVILRDLSLELRPGETTSLVGDSGSGKTTLLSVLAGLLQPDSGTLTFSGDS